VDIGEGIQDILRLLDKIKHIQARLRFHQQSNEGDVQRYNYTEQQSNHQKDSSPEYQNCLRFGGRYKNLPKEHTSHRCVFKSWT